MDFHKDYYKILGVERYATREQIKSAYRKLVMKYHPDRNKSATAAERMQSINEAYEILSDPESRKEYDDEQETESADLTRPSKQKPPWWSTWFGDYDEDYESNYRSK